MNVTIYYIPKYPDFCLMHAMENYIKLKNVIKIIIKILTKKQNFSTCYLYFSY